MGPVITKPCMKVVAGPEEALICKPWGQFLLWDSLLLCSRPEINLFRPSPLPLLCLPSNTEDSSIVAMVSRPLPAGQCWNRRTETWGEKELHLGLKPFGFHNRSYLYHSPHCIETYIYIYTHTRSLGFPKGINTNHNLQSIDYIKVLTFLLGTSEQMENAAGADNVFLPLGKLVTVTCLSCLFWHFTAWNCSVT